jgi:hypothetical protein
MISRYFRIISLAIALAACDTATEAPRVTLPLVAESTAFAPVTNDLGWTVQLTEARVAVADLAFSVAGEVHTASVLDRLLAWLVPAVHAHPGHTQGGGITGELAGRHIIAWARPETSPIGDATLLVGTYTSANFTFVRAATSDGLAPTDPLVGHTAHLAGTAERDGVTIAFTALIDAPEGRALIGAPFATRIARDTTGIIAMRLLPTDPAEGDTLFDSVDFGALDVNGVGSITLVEPATDATTTAIDDAYLRLRRTFMTHDHFDFQLTEPQ